MIVAGIWTEKGLGFVVPGFIPTPLGDFVQYVPTTNELLICGGMRTNFNGNHASFT